MAATLLEQPLADLRREITDLRQVNILHDYDMTKLARMIAASRDTLQETGNFQQQLLQQLQQFEISLADINHILRANVEEKAQLEQRQQQKQSENDLEIRAKLMALNAEALECRAAAVQLQQDARQALSRAAELEKRANDELAQQALEMKQKQQEIERSRAAELEKRVRSEEERQRMKDLQTQQQQQQQHQQLQQRSLPAAKTQSQQPPPQEDEYANWIARDFMHDDQIPPCVVRVAPHSSSIPLEISYLNVSETEHLLDNQEELIGTPLQVKFHSTDNDPKTIVLAMPYLVKRSTHRENVVKIRQPNGIWISLDTRESMFDSHKEKRFVQCQLNQSAACAVVSRLKRDTIFMDKQASGRFLSSVDPRLTVQWPRNVSENDVRLHLRVQPVELSAFTQFCQHFSHECQGLLAVGPIIDLNADDVSLLKPIQMTLPILVQAKKKVPPAKVNPADPTANNPSAPTGHGTSQPSQQEIIFQQQQSIFRSMLGEDNSNERLILLYCLPNENSWHVDANVRVTDSKTHDTITTEIQSLHTRMIVARCDKQLMGTKKLQTTISLLEQTLSQRSVSFLLRRRIANPHEICLVCCSSQRTDGIDQELQQENYSVDEEQAKEVILQEGQLLELRFRGNVLPIDQRQQAYPFAFNTYFPFYFETNVSEIDKYSQHFSSYFYGFLQIFSKQKVLKIVAKELDKKKTSVESAKQEWVEADVCLAELLIRLPKAPEENPTVVAKTLATFPSEGILTPALFRDIGSSLAGEEWVWLARRLSMTRIRIEAIEHDHHEDAPYYMLLAWFKRVPRSADKVVILIQALMGINRWDLAQDLQNLRDEKRQEQRLASKEDQLKLLRVPFNRVCQRDECLRIWKQIARELTLTNEDIERIEQQYSSKQERCLRSLESWVSKDIRADVPTLARTLRSLGFKPLAREIEQMA